ncbi:hypothetical protein N7G274_000256 [Stereocaulon virgatum]|uniref:Uncharacterized protein n=1 Tax=Stereocaulon virgatum TaxID=373712 RepID=A0ABR4ASX9_9LECA
MPSQHLSVSKTWTTHQLMASLPGEIRNRVYYYLVVHNKALEFESINTDKDPKYAKAKRVFYTRLSTGWQWSGMTNKKFRPATTPIDSLPLELQRLLYTSNAQMIQEARAVFYSENTFRITDPCSEFLSSYNLISHDPRLQSNPTACLGKLCVAVPATTRFGSTARYSTFIRSLVSCPTIREFEVDIRVWDIEVEDDFQGFRNVTATVAVLAKAYIELRSRIGRDLRLWIAAICSKTEMVVQNSEISWLFQTKPGNMEECSKIMLKDLLPSKLTMLSITRDEFKNRDREEDQLINLVVAMAYAVQLEEAKEKWAAWDGLAILKYKLRHWITRNRFRSGPMRIRHPWAGRPLELLPDKAL